MQFITSHQIPSARSCPYRLYVGSALNGYVPVDEVAPAQHASGAGENEEGEGEGVAAAVDTAGQAERDKHQLHRSRVLSELIETERDYVKDMRTVVEVQFVPGAMRASEWRRGETDKRRGCAWIDCGRGPGCKPAFA